MIGAAAVGRLQSAGIVIAHELKARDGEGYLRRAGFEINAESLD